MRFLLWSLLCISILPFFAYEGIRFYTHHGQCQTRHTQNQLLLENVLCSDPWQTLAHGPKQQAACDKAFHENQVSILSCTWQEMWLNGELNRVWSAITDNVWTLFAFIMPVVMLTVVLLFSSCNEGRARRDMMQMQKEMYRETLQSVGAGVSGVPGVPFRERPHNVYLEDEEYIPNTGNMYNQRKRNYIQLIRQE